MIRAACLAMLVGAIGCGAVPTPAQQADVGLDGLEQNGCVDDNATRAAIDLCKVRVRCKHHEPSCPDGGAP